MNLFLVIAFACLAVSMASPFMVDDESVHSVEKRSPQFYGGYGGYRGGFGGYGGGFGGFGGPYGGFGGYGGYGGGFGGYGGYGRGFSHHHHGYFG